MDIANLLIAVAGILVGILIARIQMRHDRQLAKDSGALRKPEIGLAVYDCKLGEGYPDNEDWYFMHPGNSEDYAVFPIKFTIYNMGDAATDEILISMHVPNSIFWKSQLDLMVTSTYPSLLDEKVKQSVDEIGNFSIISYSLPSLSPKVGFDLVLPFSIKPTLKDFSFPVKIEELTVNPHVKVLYFNAISVFITSGDLPPSTYQIKMGAISAVSINDGVQKYLATKKKPEKKSTFGRIRDFFQYVTELKVTNFLAFDIEDQVQNEKQRVFIMKLPDSFSRGGWLNWSSRDVTELAQLNSGSILGVIEVEKVLRSKKRKFRFPEGNLVEEK